MLQTGNKVVIEGGRSLSLGQPLASGGEGKVFAASAGDQVVKVYHQPPATGTVAKLRYMIANPPADPERDRGHASIAWPSALVKHGGQVVGFAMPRAPRGKQLVVLLNPRDRKRWVSDFTWQGMLAVGRNLARAFQHIHEKGYVIGDVKPENIHVTHESLITILDTDSFQVLDAQRKGFYPCKVFTPGYTAPELLVHPGDGKPRRAEQDAFALAVIIYKLLMATDAHPFHGVWCGPGDEPDNEDDLVRHGWYVHKPGSFMQPKPSLLPASALPQDLASLLDRCFVLGHQSPASRPQAQEWFNVLDRTVSNNAVLARCTREHRHIHMRGMACPWCQLLTLHGVNYFAEPPPGASPPVPSQSTASPAQSPAPAGTPAGPSAPPLPTPQRITQVFDAWITRLSRPPLRYWFIGALLLLALVPGGPCLALAVGVVIVLLHQAPVRVALLAVLRRALDRTVTTLPRIGAALANVLGRAAMSWRKVAAGAAVIGVLGLGGLGGVYVYQHVADRRAVEDGMARATVQEIAGDDLDALTSLTAVLKVSPDHPEALAMRERITVRMQERERQRDVSQSLAQAKASEAAGQMKEALATVEALLHRAPGHPEALALQQRIKVAMEQERQDTVDRLLADARASDAAGKPAEALAALNALLKVSPGNSTALGMREDIRTRSKQTGKRVNRGRPNPDRPPTPTPGESADQADSSDEGSDAAQPSPPEDDPGNLSAYSNRIGETVHFQVTGSTRGAVWGTTVYTLDSTLAAAAVHAGMVKEGETAVVKVSILAGKERYSGSVRNGVTTADWGPWHGSYRVEKSTHKTRVAADMSIPLEDEDESGDE